MGRFRRALHLCASLVVCLTLALLASRWQATRALDAARGRTEALGLRFDTDTRELPRAPVVEAAIADAWRVCRAIDDATGQRYDAEHGSSVYDEAAYDALLREEAGRASEELMVAVERYLAVGAAPRRLALPYGGVRLVPEGADEAPDDEGVLVLYLVQHLCRAASVDVEAGYGAGAWRQLEAAAEVCMTLRDTDLHSFSLLGGGLRRLKSSFEEAVAADASDPARARIRATLGELDVAHMAPWRCGRRVPPTCTPRKRGRSSRACIPRCNGRWGTTGGTGPSCTKAGRTSSRSANVRRQVSGARR
jgi:hypothetical protein